MKNAATEDSSHDANTLLQTVRAAFSQSEWKFDWTGVAISPLYLLSTQIITKHCPGRAEPFQSPSTYIMNSLSVEVVPLLVKQLEDIFPKRSDDSKY